MDSDTMRTSLLAFALVGQFFFVMFYLTLPWWKTFMGRALFLKAVVLTGVLGFLWASRVWEFREDDGAFNVVYAMLAFGIWLQVAAFLRVYLDGGPDDL